MSKMIDLIRQSAVPANIVRSAARGALSLPPAETIEILVYLASHPLFGPHARMTLAGWDESSSLAAMADAHTPPEVLAYFLVPQNRRPRLIPALLENPAVTESQLLDLAKEPSSELITMLLGSERVRSCANVLQALSTNPQLSPKQWSEVQAALSHLEGTAHVEHPEAANDDNVLELEVARFLRENAAEIAAAEGAPFHLMGGFSQEELAELEVAPPKVPDGAPSKSVAAGGASAAAGTSAAPERQSPLQRISKLTVGERIQLAMRGTREERFILIRDTSRLVSSGVLESPKLTDSEAELFASMKNVQESVLRGIAGKRKFIKLYAVVRALTGNPRCPIDISVPLIKNLLVQDLKNLCMNKNVSDTVQKLASRMLKEKSANR